MAEEPKQPTTPNTETQYGEEPGASSTHGAQEGEPVSYTVEDRPDDYASRYGAVEPYTAASGTPAEIVPVVKAAEPPPPPPPPASSSGDDEDDEEEDGMLRMSFLEHLEELRIRLIRGLSGLGVAFFLAMTVTQQLWDIVQRPAAAALTSLGYPPYLVFTSPMDAFLITWFKLPLLVSVFLASPWILYQAWGFIAPGLYKKERRLAVPFVISTAGLFILGGAFAYFVAFPYGLAFLLGVGQGVNIRPMITITEYFDIFVNVILGCGVVFELPVLVFMLTLLRIVTPAFLVNHSRYAILIIVIIAAVVTPTPDIFNLMLFSAPMVALYFVGVFASYLLVLRREGRRFPWGILVLLILGIVALTALAVWLMVARYGFHYVPYWPFLTK